MADYCSATELAGWLQISDVATHQTQLARAVTAVSRWIEGACSRQFSQLTETRTFAPPSCEDASAYRAGLLRLGDYCDLVSVTTLKTDSAGDGTYETTWAATEYELLPIARYGPEQTPYTSVRALARPWPYVNEYARSDLVQIAGVWGWPAVPDSIKQAALIMSARVFKRRYSPEGVAGFGDVNATDVVAELDFDVSALISPYQLWPDGGIA